MQMLDVLARKNGDIMADYEFTTSALTAASVKLDQTRKAQAEELAAIRDRKAQIDAEVAKTKQMLQAARARQQAREAAQAAQAAQRDTPARSARPAPTGPLPAVGGDVGKVIAYARAQIGKPYSWGAAGPGSFDCSGLTMMAYAQIGISLPHCSSCQASGGAKVPFSQRQPGDLIWRPGHIALYVGNGQQIAATHTGDFVRLQPAGDGQYVRILR
jgi:cell wall-associated NlpC family hydrolase